MKPQFVRYTGPGRLRIVPVNVAGWILLAALILMLVLLIGALTPVANFDGLGGIIMMVALLLGGLAVVFLILFNLSVPADQFNSDVDDNA